MAYVPGYDYDIFISYAHVDNLTAEEDEDGWVAQFQKHLEVRLSMLAGRVGLVKIWWDDRLDGSRLFDKTIQDAINGSALFVALTSNGYLASEYCQQELGWFHGKAQQEPVGLTLGDRARIFNLLLQNIPYQSWPEKYGRTSGYPFHDAERDDELGAPHDPKEKAFKQQLRELSEAIFGTLKTCKEVTASGKAPTNAAPGANSEPAKEKEAVAATATTGQTVFLADTSDALRTLRRRIVNELQQQGITLAAQIPPPYEAAAHDEKVRAELRQTQLSVHLLDAYPGRELEGAPEKAYPQRQAELAIESAQPQMIWLPQGLDLATVEDEAYRVFLTGLESGQRGQASYRVIRETPSAITREIVAQLAQLNQSATDDDTFSAALLDTHLKDQLHALELSKYLLERNVTPYVNPEADDPSKNIRVLEERLKQVSRLIVVFGNVAEEWVRARLSEAVKIALTENYPLKALGVYFAPPRQKGSVKFSLGLLPIHQFDSQDLNNPQSLAPLLGEA